VESDKSRPKLKLRQLDPNAKKIIRGTVSLLVLIVVFLFGLNIGNGRISFLISGENKNLPNTLDYSSVNQVYNLLRTTYDGSLDQTKLLDGIKNGLTTATGDPYTMYFTKDQAKDFNNQLNGTFTGIGAELGKNDSGNLIVVSPIDGFPAAKAGLRPQDVLASINGKSTDGVDIDTAVSQIRGPKGTQVTLQIVRNKTENLKFTITRDDIKVPSVKWQVLDGGVGYVQVNQFGDDTVDLMAKASGDLKAQGIKSILLDLRGNPGGLLSAAVDMASYWVPGGKTILQEKRGSTIIQTYNSTAQDPAAFAGLPTVVLVNAGSASASEIVAGALHDNNVATIYGEKSYGKGSVQEVHNLPGGAEIKITVARWYRPNGQNIDKKGIAPDKVITMTDDNYKNGQDPQKDAALDYLRSK